MNLSRFILAVLDALPADRLLGAEAITGLLPVGIEATPDDVRRELRTLAGKRQVFAVTTDDGALYKITPAGQARIA